MTMPPTASAQTFVHASTSLATFPPLMNGTMPVVIGPSPPVIPDMKVGMPVAVPITTLALPGMNGKGSGFADGVMVAFPMTKAGAAAVALPELIVAVKVLEETTSVSVMIPAGVAVEVLVFDGARLIDPASGTLLSVIVVVVVKFCTWTNATGLAEAPPGLHVVKPR